MQFLSQTSQPDEILQEYEKFKDISSAIDHPAPPFPWAILIIIVVITGITLLIWWSLKKKKSKEKVEPIKTPAEIALLALDKLKRKDLIQKNQLKEFTYEVNIILRRYLEGALSIRAPEQTTEEFLSSQAFQQLLNQQQKETLKIFLEFCDLIKYANEQVGAKEINNLLDQAKKFIRQSEFLIDSQEANKST